MSKEGEERCSAQIWVKDTYRVDRSAKGKRRGGFSMHYNRKQCSRRAMDDGRCWQHPRKWFQLDYPFICSRAKGDEG